MDLAFRLELAEKWTVLVGKNGAGKSVILEEIVSRPRLSAGATSGSVGRCQVEFEGVGGRLFLEQIVEMPKIEEPFTSPPKSPLTERCWFEGEEPLWTSKEGHLEFQDGSSLAIPIGEGALSMFEQLTDAQKEVVGPPCLALLRVKRVYAGVPRQGIRSVSFLYRKGEPGWKAGEQSRLSDLIVSIANGTPSEFEELRSAAEELGLLKTLRLENAKSEHFEFAMLLADGVNVGLLSDGTQRALEILWSLVSKTGLLCIEEPETGFHPGLLSRLLNVIESHAGDRQIVISTHSPQVLARTQPSELRFVSNNAGKIAVKPLAPEAVAGLATFLEETGTVGDFVFNDEEHA